MASTPNEAIPHIQNQKITCTKTGYNFATSYNSKINFKAVSEKWVSRMS
jgi:hypothetical protein